jgi:hypothetical protein
MKKEQEEKLALQLIDYFYLFFLSLDPSYFQIS